MFANSDDESLRGYVVWQPMLGGKEKHVKDATRLVPDDRATHYWDGPGATIRGYQETFSLPEPAWDIYMVYGPDARWAGDQPPRPAYWMHQLGSASEPRVDGPYLDAERFGKEVSRVMKKSDS